jgi:hypothetical protein
MPLVRKRDLDAGFHGGEYEDSCILGAAPCGPVHTDRCLREAHCFHRQSDDEGS